MENNICFSVLVIAHTSGFRQPVIQKDHAGVQVTYLFAELIYQKQRW